MLIEDAMCLADQPDRSNGDCVTAFRAYQEKRHLRTGRAQIMARVYGEVGHASGPPVSCAP